QQISLCAPRRESGFQPPQTFFNLTTLHQHPTAKGLRARFWRRELDLTRQFEHFVSRAQRHFAVQGHNTEHGLEPQRMCKARDVSDATGMRARQIGRAITLLDLPEKPCRNALEGVSARGGVVSHVDGTVLSMPLLIVEREQRRDVP